MKKAVSYLLFFGLAAVLLYLSFREVQWSDFREGLRTTNYYWILFSMVLGAYSSWIRGMRWRLLIRGAGHGVGKGNAFDAVNVAYLTNFALPRAGEVARCGMLARTAGVPFDALLGTVVLERLFDVICLAGITVLVVALQWRVFGLFMEQQLWHPVMRAFNGNILYIILILLACVALIVLMAVYKNRLQKYAVFKKIYGLAAGLSLGLKSGFTMPRKVPFLLYTLVLWLIYWATGWCTILAFPATADLTLLDALFLMVVGSLGWVVPVQGGIGAFHFIVSLALVSVYGISQTQGLVFATISHESQALIMIVFGLFSMIRAGLYGKRKVG